MNERNAQDWTPCEPGVVANLGSQLVKQKRLASLAFLGTMLLAASVVGLTTWMIATSFSDPKPREQETKSTKPRTPFKAKATTE